MGRACRISLRWCPPRWPQFPKPCRLQKHAFGVRIVRRGNSKQLFIPTSSCRRQVAVSLPAPCATFKPRRLPRRSHRQRCSNTVMWSARLISAPEYDRVATGGRFNEGIRLRGLDLASCYSRASTAIPACRAANQVCSKLCSNVGCPVGNGGRLVVSELS